MMQTSEIDYELCSVMGVNIASGEDGMGVPAD